MIHILVGLSPDNGASLDATTNRSLSKQTVFLFFMLNLIVVGFDLVTPLYRWAWLQVEEMHPFPRTLIISKV